MNAETPCLDAEVLASFVDGRLGVRDRKAAVEHLADCARCYEVVAEALHFREVEEESHPPLRLVSDTEGETPSAEASTRVLKDET